jgi:hypothetical protein
MEDVAKATVLSFLSKDRKTSNDEQRLGMAWGRPIVGRAEAGMPEPEPTRMYPPAYRR